MNELFAYEVLKPIAYKGDRIEKGSVIHMEETEAANIGEEYLKLADNADEKDIPSEPKEPDEVDTPSEEQKPADETENHNAETGAAPDEAAAPEEQAPAQTDDKPNETL
jgi:hypothetical protein